MKGLLKNYSERQHDGDCFVCCILSHGSADGVHGTDGGVVRGSDVYDQFNRISCPSLIIKPKVFLIQACRGGKSAQPVNVQSDSNRDENAGEEQEEELGADAVQITIPAEADFLVARSTVKGYFSFRERSGSWFIQCLCEQLKKCCLMGVDVLSILLKVNDEIGEIQK